MVICGLAEKHKHYAIMKATSLPVQTSKSNIVQLLCKSPHRQWPARRELWEMFPKMFPSCEFGSASGRSR